ncbi:MAG: DUF2946 family protein [Sneathiella sp.]
MMSIGLKNSVNRACMASATRRKIFSWLAFLAVFLNMLVPVTHGLISSAEAGEFVEICTRNGVELVKLDLSADGEEDPAKMSGICGACADCPVCHFGAVTYQVMGAGDLAPFDYRSTQNTDFWTSSLSNPDPPWARPALRAPPVLSL